jgi:amidohydrolase
VTTTAAGWITSLRTALSEELPAAVALRHALHAEPELSGHEQRTAARVAAALGQPGAADVSGGRLIKIGAGDAPVIAVRAELDALPIVEDTGVTWAARNGAAHVCGHDVHLAALVALARAMQRFPGPLPLLAVLQPREETYPSGAKDLVGSAAFTRHDVLAVIGAHLQPRLARGVVTAGAGPVNAAADEFRIAVHGHGGHAAYPQSARDPIVAIAHVVVALQHLISRRTDPLHAAVLTVGAVHAGEAANVIPATAAMRGTLRTFEPADRQRLQTAIEATARATATAYECTAEVSFIEGEPVLRNDARLAAVTEPELRAAGLHVVEPLRSCGADDFSYYCSRYPSLMMFVGVGPGSADAPGLHHPSFLPSDDAVADVATSMLAGYVGACALHAPAHNSISPMDSMVRQPPPITAAGDHHD